MVAPVAISAGFTPPWAVSPLKPGSVLVTLTSILLGGSTEIACPFQSVTLQLASSVNQFYISSIVPSEIANWS